VSNILIIWIGGGGAWRGAKQKQGGMAEDLPGAIKEIYQILTQHNEELHDVPERFEKIQRIVLKHQESIETQNVKLEGLVVEQQRLAAKNEAMRKEVDRVVAHNRALNEALKKMVVDNITLKRQLSQLTGVEIPDDEAEVEVDPEA